MAQDCAACEEAPLTEGDMNDIEDVISGLDFLAIHNISHKGIKNLNDVRKKLRQHLASAQSDAKASAGSGTSCAQINSDKIRDLIVAQREGNQKMVSLVQKIKTFVAELPKESIRKDLLEAIPDTNERLKWAQEALETDEFSILVAGDTGSGKSTFLNLLLDNSECNILPVAHISSTSAICEIRYKEEPALEVRESGSTEFKNIPLQNKMHALEEISKHSHQRKKRDEEFKYDKVRIYWPVEWLKNNIMVVDSPGIAENPKLTKMVKEYIPKASGFIYIINPTIDGGFSPDKLQDLLFAHLEKEKRQRLDHAFDHRSAIFVCNKWDDIKKDERKEMVEHIKKNLRKIWREFDQDQQLFFVSAKQAVAALKDAFIPEDYKKLLLGLERLLPIACQNRLMKQYWSLREVVQRANLTLRLDLRRQNTDEMQEGTKYLKIIDDLNRILNDQKKMTSDLHEMAADEVGASLLKLKHYLTAMWDKLLKWEVHECPKVPRCHDDLDIELEHAANIRITQCIEEWVLTNNIFGKIEARINYKFNAQFSNLRAELNFIENYKLVPGNIKVEYIPAYANSNSVYGHPESHKGENSLIKDMLKFGRYFAQLVFTMGYASFSFKSVRDFFKGKTAEVKVETYNKDRPGSMKDMTRHLLSKLMEDVELKEIFGDSINELYKSIDNLLSRLPNIIKANRQLVEQKIPNLSTCTKEIYEAKHRAGFDLENEINTVYLRHIKTYDIDIDDLKPDDWKEIGKGHYSIVYAANYKGQNVAVKKPNDLARGYTSTNFILEETNFRNLNMANIVNFKGTAVQKEENCVYPLLVLEYCQCSLAKIVLQSDNYTAPGTVQDQNERENGAVYKTAARYAMDISTALTSLHTRGYVHRDLKLENMLVDAVGRVKLADLGLCKLTTEIIGSQAGTPIYMAPEVQKGKIYNISADIFSLGMVIWELWYGICVGEKYNSSNLDDFKENCFTDYAPPKQLMELIQNCLKRDPDARPTADDAFQFFCSTTKPANEAVGNN